MSLATKHYLHNASSGLDIVRAWHDDVADSGHAGSFDLCLEQPCHALRTYRDDHSGWGGASL